jgi:hypothetical protein
MVRTDITYPAFPGCPITETDTHDDVWLPVVGQEGWSAIMRDKRVRFRPGERRAIIDHNVKAFIMTGAGNYSRWQTLDLLVRRWDRMEAIATSLKPPFICAITQGGIEQRYP